MLLGLDDVHPARPAVAVAGRAAQVVQGDVGRGQGVQHALGNLFAGPGEHRVGGHQVAHDAHQQQAAAGQRERRAIGADVLAVGVQGAQHVAPALGEFGRQVAPEQAQQVAVGQGLVRPVHHGHGVLAVEDGGHGRLQHHVPDPGGMLAADGVLAVDADFRVQAVVAQQHRAVAPGGRAGMPGETVRVGQARFRAVLQGDRKAAAAHVVARRVGMAAPGQREGLVQEGGGPRHHQRPARGIVRAAARRSALCRVFGNHVGAVQGVVQAAPAGVGRVQGVAGVGDGHHQLRPGHQGDFRVHPFGGHGEVRPLGHQVADGPQEGLVGGPVVRSAAPLAVPGVDGVLQSGPFRQQGAVPAGHGLHHVLEGRPEPVGVHAGARRDVADDDVIQRRCDLQATHLNALRHVVLL